MNLSIKNILEISFMLKDCWKEIVAQDNTYVIIDQLKSLLFFKGNVLSKIYYLWKLLTFLICQVFYIFSLFTSYAIR